MTQAVIWLCRDCERPVHFTCTLRPLGNGLYRAHAEPHIHAHLRQHEEAA